MVGDKPTDRNLASFPSITVHLIHWTICKHTGLQVTERYYEHISEGIINVNSTTTMWDVLVITDRTILANRPDIVMHD